MRGGRLSFFPFAVFDVRHVAPEIQPITRNQEPIDSYFFGASFMLLRCSSFCLWRSGFRFAAGSSFCCVLVVLVLIDFPRAVSSWSLTFVVVVVVGVVRDGLVSCGTAFSLFFLAI